MPTEMCCRTYIPPINLGGDIFPIQLFPSISPSLPNYYYYNCSRILFIKNQDFFDRVSINKRISYFLSFFHSFIWVVRTGSMESLTSHPRCCIGVGVGVWYLAAYSKVLLHGFQTNKQTKPMAKSNSCERTKRTNETNERGTTFWKS